MVTKRREWYKQKFISVFGGVKIVEKEGYYVFVAEKGRKGIKPTKNQKRLLSSKLQRKYCGKSVSTPSN